MLAKARDEGNAASSSPFQSVGLLIPGVSCSFPWFKARSAFSCGRSVPDLMVVIQPKGVLFVVCYVIGAI